MNSYYGVTNLDLYAHWDRSDLYFANYVYVCKLEFSWRMTNHQRGPESSSDEVKDAFHPHCCSAPSA